MGSAEIPSSPALAALGSCKDVDTLRAGFGCDLWGALGARSLQDIIQQEVTFAAVAVMWCCDSRV